MKHGKVARDARAMLGEAEETAARVCKPLHKEHEWRAKYVKHGKIHNYSLKNAVWAERHHRDVLTRYCPKLWCTP